MVDYWARQKSAKEIEAETMKRIAAGLSAQHDQYEYE